MSFLNFSFDMIYVTYKMLVLLKDQLNYLKDNISKCFLMEYNRLLILFLKIVFFIIYDNRKFNFS